MALGSIQTKFFQRVLKQAGLYDGPIDGIYDSDVRRAATRWQQKHGLPVSGEYDTATDQYLKQVMGNLEKPSNDKVNELLTPEVREYIEENYGYLAHFLNHAELGPIIALAATANWDQTKLFGAVQKTNWWKTHSESARAWEKLRFEDPAEAARRRHAQEAVVRDVANQLGLNPGAKRLSTLVENSIRWGWTDAELKDALGKRIKWNPDNKYPTGQLGTDMRKVMEMADEWMVPMHARQAFSYAKKVAQGTIKIEDVENNLMSMATAAYPQLADRIKAGISPRQFFDIYRQQIAQTLEVSPDSINFTKDPKWAKVVSYQRPDAKGGTTTDIMNLAEATEYARQQPEFRRTKGAEDTASELARTLSDTFGQTAPSGSR